QSFLSMFVVTTSVVLIHVRSNDFSRSKVARSPRFLGSWGQPAGFLDPETTEVGTLNGDFG
ncbi:hypothetical protein NG791_03695, partial [Laspinema sp. D1]|uniref:hypothetical protein n=1 Tax=Laspinema palackyanum TaxID=3231601 RepID=UPI00347BCBAE|nr:hypothetical protein [Laspinema sp. D2b]